MPFFWRTVRSTTTIGTTSTTRTSSVMMSACELGTVMAGTWSVAEMKPKLRHFSWSTSTDKCAAKMELLTSLAHAKRPLYHHQWQILFQPIFHMEENKWKLLTWTIDYSCCASINWWQATLSTWKIKLFYPNYATSIKIVPKYQLEPDDGLDLINSNHCLIVNVMQVQLEC